MQRIKKLIQIAIKYKQKQQFSVFKEAKNMKQRLEQQAAVRELVKYFRKKNIYKTKTDLKQDYRMSR